MNVKNSILLLVLAFLAFACSPDATSQKEQTDVDPDEAMAMADTEEEAMVFPADSITPDSSMSFHGLRISDEGAQPISELENLLADNGSIQTKISGPVESACQVKGCWMMMKMADGSDMRVRFKDYGFFVPKDAGGKLAVVEGKAFLDTTTVDMLKHYAEDAGKSQEEIDAITDPEISIAFEATGVIIKDESN